ncbi:protein of unknown function [Candidatus Promineifilum breve]|uniref:Uncharacterized protein n=1 Tax=Candidatus Promineifilum breve TaxID=1806508 RepID=A0A160T4A8_9CHLR|nr:protein of unknown function [Candidatus Promineifilum breve]
MYFTLPIHRLFGLASDSSSYSVAISLSTLYARCLCRAIHRSY